MSLKTYFPRMCYSLLYQVFRSAYYGIIAALSRRSYSKMYIRHKYNVPITHKVHHIRHCTAQTWSIISIQSARVSLIKLYQYWIFFLRIIIFGKIKQSFVRLILVIRPLQKLNRSPFIFILLGISGCYSDWIGEIRFTPP